MARQRLECARFIAALSRSRETQSATCLTHVILSQSGDKSHALQTLRDFLYLEGLDGRRTDPGRVAVVPNRICCSAGFPSRIRLEAGGRVR